MSDIGSLIKLAPSQAQLPVEVYFDDSMLAREKELLFSSGPGYVGHELMIPEIGDFQTVYHENQGRALVRTPEGPQLISNVCRHRQAQMLDGRGNTPHVVCPLHRWTYDLKGQLIGAPQFTTDPCLHLKNDPLQNWNGLLFSSARNIQEDLKDAPFNEFFNFEGYRYHKSHYHQCHYNWKSFIEVYMDDYHVAPFHPGLGKFVNCNNLEWHYGKNWSVQAVGITDLMKSGSATYKRWQEQVRNFTGGNLPEFGAIWMTLYPNIMLEWYPNVLVVSTLWPAGPQSTMNVVDFFYPEEIALFEPEYVACEQDAYMETAIEDDEIAERMDRGRKCLLDRGVSEVGPYHSPMEDGMQHFHEWLRRELSL